MEHKPIAWLSPTSGQIFSHETCMDMFCKSQEFPDDLMPLVFLSSLRRLEQLLAITAKELEDMTCAMESIKADLHEIQGVL